MDKTPKQWLQHRNIVFHNLPKMHRASCVLKMAKFKAFHEMPGNFRHFAKCLSESGISRNT